MNSPLRELLSGRTNEALSEIPRMNPDVVLDTDVEILVEQIFEGYRYNLPKLDIDHITSELIPQNLHQTTYKFRVPFKGDKELFFHRPESYWHQFPRAQIEGSYLAFGFPFQQQSSADVEAQGQRVARHIESLFERELDLVQKFLGEVIRDVEQFHGVLKDNLRSRLNHFRGKIQADRASISAMKYPLHKRQDAGNYEVPLVRKSLSISATSGHSSSPDAILEMAKYEEILSTLSHMARVMERNPVAFSTMDEEDIRHFFLLMLNAIYEGRATGETFNGRGKSDILIRENDQNVFIAECKFWGGQKLFTETIDQLMGYTTWNDTKTAIILFNRNKDFTAVLNQITQTVQAHPNYKRLGKVFKDKTYFQYIFTHKDDPLKEFWITIIAFNVPTSKNSKP